ncbi:MAG TPA: hypothetical protein VEC17_02790 [Candidatus Binatia bacterium]|nr:hypothetical protein [Candidatus Binatia bacterium]
MKKLIAGLSLLALAVAVVPAGAATISNVAGSTAEIRYRLSSMLSLTNSNDAELQNEVAVGSNSGGNSMTSVAFQSHTGVTTGDATGVVEVLNEANVVEVDTSLDWDFGPASDDHINSIWDGSDVLIRNRQTDDQSVTNTNTVANANAIAVAGNTGDNTTSSDEGLQNASITTGASASAAGLTNRFNRISESITRMVR